jgi:Family of unknown function (DUF6682)
MPATLLDAIARVRSELDEPAYPSLANSTGSPSSSPQPRFFTDTELTAWIAQGLRDISRRAEDLITKDQTISIPAFAGTGSPTSFQLLNDIIRINRVEFVPVNQTNQIYRVEPSTQNEMDQIWGTYQQNPSSYPRWYVLLGYPGGTGRNAFMIQLYPVASQAGTLNVYYYRIPTPLTDPVANPSMYSTTLDIVEGWDDLAVEYAVYKGLQKQRNPEWQARKQEYEMAVAQMIDVTRKFHDQQSYISYGTNMLPSWLVGGGEW